MFNRSRSRSNPEELRRRVSILHDEIAKLEQVLESPSPGTDPGTSEVAVHKLRASIVQEELVRKRAEYEIVTTEARSAGVDVEEAIATPAASRIIQLDGRTRAALAAPAARRRSGRRGVMLALLGSMAVIILLSVALLWSTGRIGGLGRSGPIVGGSTTPLAAPVELAPIVASAAVSQRGETFYTGEIQFDYQRGRVYLSGDPPPESQFSVDDGMRLKVTHPDGSSMDWSRDFNAGCIQNTNLPPQDVTNLFRPGTNRVEIALYDICGGNMGAVTPIWLSNRELPPSGATGSPGGAAPTAGAARQRPGAR